MSKQNTDGIMVKQTRMIPGLGIDDTLSEFERDAVLRLTRGDKSGGKEGILASMIKRILETSLEGELTVHLAEERTPGLRNLKNGKQSKGLKTQYGQIELQTHRDRAGSF